ncbi:uncharacterized protein V1477_002504, partial [Vespula maculifrons]
MSCLNCQSMDHGIERIYHLDTPRSYDQYNTIHSPNIRSPCNEMYTELSYVSMGNRTLTKREVSFQARTSKFIILSGSYTTAGWITPMSVDYSRSTTGTDTSGESRFNCNMIN